MRRIASRSGRYNIPNVGIFLWRVQALRLDALAARRRRRLGPALPLRRARDRQAALRAARGPSRRSRTSPSRSTCRCRSSGASRRRTSPISTAPVCRSCSRPRRRAASTGPRRGRPHLRPLRRSRGARNVGARAAAGRHARRRRPRARARRASPPRPDAGETRLATFHYGSALAVGGGGYDRAASLERSRARVVTVSGGDPLGPPLAAVAGGGAVQILDSRRYAAPATITATTPAPNAADRALVAARGEPHAAAALARPTSSGSRWIPTRRSS